MDVLPHIIVRPETHRCRDRFLIIESIAAVPDPIAGSQRRLRRHRSYDSNSACFLGILVDGLFLHLHAATSADVKRRVEHVLPSFSDLEAGRLTVGPDAIEVLLDIIGILLAESDPVNPFRLFFRDARIAAFLNDLAECELRLYPNDVFLGFHEFPDLRELQAGVTVNGDDLRVESSADVQENGAVLAP